jgi:DNA-binding CsgD family transcriptional regulator
MTDTETKIDFQKVYSERLSKYNCVVTEDDYAAFEKIKSYLIRLSEIESKSMAVFDLCKKKFIFFSSRLNNGIHTVCDDNSELLNDFYARLHPDDLNFVLDTKIKMFDFQAGLQPQELKDYKLVFSFRMKNEAGVYWQYVQQQAVLEPDKEGKMWLIVSITELLTEDTAKFKQQRYLINTKTKKFQPFTNESEDGSFQLLSEREWEVVALVAHGLGTPAIAKKLFISKQTVNNHRKHILAKTNIGNTAQTIQLAKCMGII